MPRVWVLPLLLAIVFSYPVYRSTSIVLPLLRTDTRTTARAWVESNLPSGSGVFLEQYAPQLEPEREEALRTAGNAAQPLSISRDEKRRRQRFDAWRKYANSKFYRAPVRGFRIYREAAWSGEITPDHVITSPLGGYWTCSQLRRLGVQYYVAVSYMYRRFGGFPDTETGEDTLPGRIPSATDIARRAFYRELATKATLVVQLSPDPSGVASNEGRHLGNSLWARLGRRPGPVIRVYELPAI